MDFHSLTRRELQSLCKLNKIPANITNVAMADALKSLEIVQGIEEFLNVSQSETADLVESLEQLEVSSPKAPNTRCRTSTRQKVKNTEAENLPPTATRTTRRGTKQAKGVEESKNDTLKTPAISSSRRKALATSSCRMLNSQLNESEEEGLVDQKQDCILNSPAAVVMNSRRKAATVKKEDTLQKTYSTRRSTRLTEKKSAEPRAKKQSEDAVKINSFLDEVNVASTEELQDEVNVTSEDVSRKLVEAQENTIGSDSPKAEVEDICNAVEKIDVLIGEDLNVEATQKSVEEKEVYGEKVGSDAKTDEVSDQKLKSDSISSPTEDGELEEKLDIGEKFDASDVNDQNPCDDENLEEKAKIEEKLDLVEKVSSKAESDMAVDQKLKSDSISSPSEDEDLEDKLDLGDEKFDASEVLDQNICDNEDLEEMLDLVEEVSSDVKTDEVFHHKPKSNSISSPSEDDEVFDASEVTDQNPCDNEDLEEKLKIEEKLDLVEKVSSEEVFDQKLKSDVMSSPSEDEDVEEKLGLGEKFDGSEVNDQDLEMVSGQQSDNVVDNNPEVFRRETEEMSDQKPESDGISSPIEDGDLEGELNLGVKFDASEVNYQNLSDYVVNVDNNPEVTVSDNISSSCEDEDLKEKLDKVVDNNPSLESVDETFDETEEMFDQKPESDGISSPIEDGDLEGELNLGVKFDASEVNYQNLSDYVVNVDNNPEVTVSDNISSSCEDEDVKDKFDNVVDNNPSLESVDETFDVISTIGNLSTVTEHVQDAKPEKADVIGRPTPIQKSLSKTPTPFKKMTFVSDDKENIDSGRKLQMVFVDEGKKMKKDKTEHEKHQKNLHEISIRQLRKQLKELTLKSINANEDAASKEVTTRPALQVLCENQLVGGETKN